jgi:hypothetical protein
MDKKVIQDENVLVERCVGLVPTHKILGDMSKNDSCKEAMEKNFLDLIQDVHKYTRKVLKKRKQTAERNSVALLQTKLLQTEFENGWVLVYVLLCT